MPKKQSQQASPVQRIRERKRKEFEERLARVKKRRASYQRKIIGTVVVVFIILIIVCALLPSNDSAAFGGRWSKDMNSRQSQIMQSLQDNFNK